MADKSGKGSSKKHHYSSYQLNLSWRKNKIKALQRHIKHYPEDAQANAALALFKDGAVQYARKNPHKRTWQRNKAKMAFAHLLRFLGGNGNTALSMPWELGHPQRTTIVPTMRNANVEFNVKSPLGVEDDA